MSEKQAKRARRERRGDYPQRAGQVAAEPKVQERPERRSDWFMAGTLGHRLHREGLGPVRHSGGIRVLVERDGKPAFATIYKRKGLWTSAGKTHRAAEGENVGDAFLKWAKGA